MSLLNDGMLLLVIGMGTVFLFLGIMVVWITFSSKILAGFSHLLPELEKETRRAPAAKAAAPTAAAEEDQAVLLAVITAAVHRYRAERGSAAS